MDFYLFCLLQSHTFIVTFVPYTHPFPFTEASLRFLAALRAFALRAPVFLC
jgi:hypothetical protein